MLERISLKYDGGPAANGEMDAQIAASIIRTFSEFSKVVIENLYGKGSKPQVVVLGHERGSHEIEFLIRATEAAGLMLTAFGPAASPLDYLGTFKATFDLIKHLGGEPPVATKRADNGGVVVENNSGTVQVYNGTVVNIVSTPPGDAGGGRFC